MIKYLPSIYPDESVYSYLCRLYVHGGFMWHRGFANEVFSRWNEYPEYNFVNALNKDFRSVLERHISFERLVLEHSLFSYYARFLPQERRLKAFNHAMNNELFIHRFLPIPTDKKDYYLRYCPVCIEADREQYGESYFHIQHQIPSVRVCALHNCELVDTAIPNTKQKSCIMIPLEQIIAENGIGETVEYEADDINIRVAKYIDEVIHQPFNFNAETLISDYLTVKLKEPYVSPRGEQRNLVELNRDMAIYFDGLRAYDITKQRLAYLFRNNSFNPYDILLSAMFACITPQDLCLFEGYNEPKHIIFDRKVRELKEQGKGVCEIGKIMGVNHEVVRKILSGTYGRDKNHVTPSRSQRWDWKTIDDDCCKEFSSRVDSYRASNPDGIISKRVVADLFDLKDKALRNLPRLMAMIADYRERKG